MIATAALKLYTRLTKTADLEAPASPINIQINSNLTSGTGANQADQQYSDSITLAASGSTEIDLYGSLTNQFGDTINFSKVRMMIFESDADNTAVLEIGGSASNAFESWTNVGGKITLRPGGVFYLSATDATGFVVTSTADKLKITNLSASVSASFNVIIIGVQA